MINENKSKIFQACKVECFNKNKNKNKQEWKDYIQSQNLTDFIFKNKNQTNGI